MWELEEWKSEFVCQNINITDIAEEKEELRDFDISEFRSLSWFKK